MPNVHKAILRLLLDWVSLCPNDFQHSTPRRELVDFLNRVACMGDNYRWLVEEIRIQAEIDVSRNVDWLPHIQPFQFAEGQGESDRAAIWRQRDQQGIQIGELREMRWEVRVQFG